MTTSFNFPSSASGAFIISRASRPVEPARAEAVVAEAAALAQAVQAAVPETEQSMPVEGPLAKALKEQRPSMLRAGSSRSV